MKSNIKSLQQASYTNSTDPRQVSKKRPKPSVNLAPASDHYNISLHILSTQLKCDDKDELYKNAISRAKDSFNRYFNDQEHLKDIDKNNDVVINIEELEDTYDKKKKIATVLKKTLKQKIIWLKVHKGVSSFNKIEREDR